MKNNKKLLIIGFFGNLFFERGIWVIYLLSIGFNMFEVSILQAILNITMFLTEIPTGYISDKLGRKKGLLSGHSFIALYLVIFLIFHDFWILSLAYILYGIGLTFISGTDQAYLYDSLKYDNSEQLYGKSIAIYNSTIIVALSLAMFIGGYIQLISWNYIFLLGLFCQLITIIIITRLKEIPLIETEDSSNSNSESSTSFASEMKKFIELNSGFKFLILSISTFFATTSIFYMFGQEILQNSGIPIHHISSLFAGIAIIQATLSIFSYKLEDKYSSKKVLIFTFGFIGLLYLFMLINHPIIIIFAFILINSLYDLVDPISSKIINNEIPSKMRATILSLINLITSLIMFIGSLLIGYLSSFINSLVLFSIIGLLTIILSTTTLTIFYKSKSSTEKVLGLNYD